MTPNTVSPSSRHDGAAAPWSSSLQANGDEVLQAELLAGVSRTFALTIPQLPAALCSVVSNAYLLCRIVDTIEDEARLNREQKRRFCRQFVEVVHGNADAEDFAAELGPLLSQGTIPAEHDLIRTTPRIIRILRGFEPRRRQCMARCVRVMAEGMYEFQDRDDGPGLRDLADLDRYCYHVAGVVGEMLTELFCHYSAEIAGHRGALLALSVPFGQGLQMTNILKDIWEDRERGACWLPRDIFEAAGFDLRELAPGKNQKEFAQALRRLVGITHDHLRRALDYTMLIPRQEKGIRNFCLWAIGMAMLTLREINRRPNFSRGDEVKISRRSVRATIAASRLGARSDLLLKAMFRAVGRSLPIEHAGSKPG